MKRRLLIITFSVLMLGLISFQSAFAADGDITSGSYDNWTYRITSEGELIVGAEGETQYLQMPADARAPWEEYAAEIKTARFAGTVIGQNLGGLFRENTNLTDIDFTGLDTGNVTDMRAMFFRCSSLTNLDLSGFDTSNVTNMNSMFYECVSLTSLNMSGVNTDKVTSMSWMFYGCSALANLDVSGFNTVAISDLNGLNGMFSGCSSLTDIDLSGFDMSSVTSATDMLTNCTSLQTIKTPKAVQIDVALPFTMYDVKGAAYTNLPKNLATSFDLYVETPDDPTPDDPDDPTPDDPDDPIPDDPDPAPISIDSASVSNIVAKTYTGKAITQAPVVKLKGVTLKNGVDYTLSYKNNINVGTGAIVMIKGKGSYTGTIVEVFTIRPFVPSLKLTKLTKGSKSFTAKWTKASSAVQKQFTGYQIQYSTSKNFSKATKVQSTTKKKVSKVVIRKLKKKKTYYVRIRRYYKWNGQTLYSAWSPAKKVKTK